MIVYDKNTFGSNREIDEVNGYLRVDECNISKCQVRPYLGREIPNWREFDLEPDKIYNVYCPREELKKAVPTFNNLPLTREHIEVDVDNVPKEKIVGSLGDHASFEYPYLKNNLIIYDKKDIDLVMSGKKKELSCGYRYTPVRQSGEADGQHYDFVMTDIVGNHVALVKQGRAGRDVMVADSSKGILETIKEKIMAVFDNDLVEDETKVNGEYEDDDDVEWITVRGVHIPIKKGEDKDAAVKNFLNRSDEAKKGIEKSFGEIDNILSKKESNKGKGVFGGFYGDAKNVGGNNWKIEMKHEDIDDVLFTANVSGMNKKEAQEAAFKEFQNYIKKDKDGFINMVNEKLNKGKEESGSEKKEERGTYENFKSPIANKIGNWYGPQGEESADKARAMREMEWTAHKIKTENNPEEKKELERDLDWEKSQFEKKFGEKPEKYGFGEKLYKDLSESSEKKEESSEKDIIESLKNKFPRKYEKKDGASEYKKERLKDVEAVSGKETEFYKAKEKEVDEDIKEAKEYVSSVIKEDTGEYKHGKDYFKHQVEKTKNRYGEESDYYKRAKLHLDLYNEMTNDSAEQEKVGVVMKEFKEGELKSGSGKKVTNPKQAIAIALSEADKIAKDKEIPEKQDEPEKAGDEVALNKGEKKMADEVKKAPAEEKVTEDACGKAEDKEVKPACDEKEDKRKLIDEIGGILKDKLSEEEWRTVIKKAEELAYNDSEASADDEDKKDLKGKEKKSFAEGVVYGEEKEKAEPKKLDSEHESEGMKKAEEKKEEKAEDKKMAKDGALVMDADAIKAEAKAEVIADFKARETARRAVRKMVGDVDVFAFDSAEEIYKFACEKAGMDLDEIVSFKDAFKGLSLNKSKLAMDASPVSGSDVECFKDIRLT